MARRLFIFAVCFGWAVCPITSTVTAAEPFHFPEGTYGKGELKYINGLPVLTVAGTPEEIGEAVGVLAMRPAGPMLDYPSNLLKHFHLHVLWRLLASEGSKMVEQFPDNYKRELDAAARGAGIDRERLVVGNTMFDLMKYFACSALLVDADHSATRGPLFGRNLDYPSLGYVHEYSLITVYRPDGAKHAFASVGFPGLIGCLSGMNDAGLTVAVLEVGQLKVGHRRFDISGTPYAICYRRILEECSTIAEARDLLEQMKRVSFTNLAIADPQGIAVFEATPQCVLLRRPQQGRCVCTNHYCSELLKPLVQLNLLKTLDRYKTLDQTAAQQERLSVEEMHHGLYKAKQAIDTVQTMVFEPAALRAHLGIGTCPSTVGDLKVLELAPLLHGQ